MANGQTIQDVENQLDRAKAVLPQKEQDKLSQIPIIEASVRSLFNNEKIKWDAAIKNNVNIIAPRADVKMMGKDRDDMVNYMECSDLVTDQEISTALIIVLDDLLLKGKKKESDSDKHIINNDDDSLIKIYKRILILVASQLQDFRPSDIEGVISNDKASSIAKKLQDSFITLEGVDKVIHDDTHKVNQIVNEALDLGFLRSSLRKKMNNYNSELKLFIKSNKSKSALGTLCRRVLYGIEWMIEREKKTLTPNVFTVMWNSFKSLLKGTIKSAEAFLTKQMSSSAVTYTSPSSTSTVYSTSTTTDYTTTTGGNTSETLSNSAADDFKDSISSLSLGDKLCALLNNIEKLTKIDKKFKVNKRLQHLAVLEQMFVECKKKDLIDFFKQIQAALYHLAGNQIQNCCIKDLQACRSSILLVNDKPYYNTTIEKDNVDNLFE